MSWSIYAKGTKEKVRKQVENHQSSIGFPQLELDQVAKAKDLILHTLDGIDLTENRGFNVEAFGSCSKVDDKIVSNNCSVKIETVDLN